MTIRQRLLEREFEAAINRIYNTYLIFSKMYSLCSRAKNLVPRLTRAACDNTKAAYIPL
jgi:hypothetical protein